MTGLRAWKVLAVGFLLEVGVGALSLVYSFATAESAGRVLGLLIFGLALVASAVLGLGLLSVPPALMLYFDRWPLVAAGWCVLLAVGPLLVAFRADWNVLHPVLVFYPGVLLATAGVAVRNASGGASPGRR